MTIPLFKKKVITQAVQWVITASADANSTISPSGSVSVTQGANKTFAIGANSGYVISGVTVDGAGVGAVSTYTFTNVTTTHTIAVTSTAAATDPYFAYVTALFHFENNFNNVIGGSLTASGTVLFDSLTPKYGTYDANFAGGLGQLYTTSQLFNPAGADWCVEGWVNPANSLGIQTILATRQSGGTYGFHFYTSSGALGVLIPNAAASAFTVSITGGDVPSGVWSHVAVVRYGNTVTLYVSGNSVNSAALTTSLPTPTANFTLGQLAGGTIPYSGLKDDVRVTVGNPRYTGNFTPPPAQMPDM